MPPPFQLLELTRVAMVGNNRLRLPPPTLSLPMAGRRKVDVFRARLTQLRDVRDFRHVSV